MKIGLIGHGYWGRIIKANLPNKKFGEVIIHDPAHPEYKKNNIDKLLSDCTHVFVATPASTHLDIVGEALAAGCNVFCEKPLVISTDNAKKLYEAAEENDVDLYVDWIFTCNPIIRKIRSLIDKKIISKRLIQASMNRMNLGPARHDVPARYDLTSHDLSILCYLLADDALNAMHKDFPQEQVENCKSHTCYSNITWTGGEAHINTSWNYPAKNRSCTFTFENATIHWDDYHGFAFLNGQPLDVADIRQPLQISIDDFLSSGYDKARNRDITLRVQGLLEHGTDKWD